MSGVLKRKARYDSEVHGTAKRTFKRLIEFASFERERDARVEGRDDLPFTMSLRNATGKGATRISTPYKVLLTGAVARLPSPVRVTRVHAAREIYDFRPSDWTRGLEAVFTAWIATFNVVSRYSIILNTVASNTVCGFCTRVVSQRVATWLSARKPQTVLDAAMSNITTLGVIEYWLSLFARRNEPRMMTVLWIFWRETRNILYIHST